MDASHDISSALSGWSYAPGDVTVRSITGEDGTEKIQLRLDLGVLQMERDGRPDGQQPDGHNTWLDAYQEAAKATKDFKLSPSECKRLMREGVQFYHRYLSFWHLGRYELCARDTQRNLRLFAFVREHAPSREIALEFDQWRPYVIMMHTRAVATPLVEVDQPAAALKAVDAGIASIWEFLEEYEQVEKAERCGELQELSRWREELVEEHALAAPPAPESLESLKHKLEAAVENEAFEEAAQLRDAIERRQATDL